MASDLGLEISPKTYYLNKVYPALVKVHKECRDVDVNLDLTVEKALNAANSSAVNNELDILEEAFDTYIKAVTDGRYFSPKGTGEPFSEEQRKMILAVPNLVSELKLIIKTDRQLNQNNVEEPKLRERIGYSIEKKENLNPETMEQIWKPQEQKRLPN